MKRLLTALIVLLAVCTSVLPASAADGKVTYDGNAQEFIFEPGSEYSPTDLFSPFKEVMPGDTLTQQITVKNDASRDVKVKIYIRSLGAHEDSADFLSQLGLTVQKSADNDMAYMFDAAANETAQLTDWVCLGTLYAGGEVNLDVVLDVPVELDNLFQSRIGYLDWEFKVEEFPVEEADPKPPQTGDSVYMGFWIAIAAFSVAVIGMIPVWRKKDREKKADAPQ